MPDSVSRCRSPESPPPIPGDNWRKDVSTAGSPTGYTRRWTTGSGEWGSKMIRIPIRAESRYARRFPAGSPNHAGAQCRQCQIGRDSPSPAARWHWTACSAHESSAWLPGNSARAIHPQREGNDRQKRQIGRWKIKHGNKDHRLQWRQESASRAWG